jgi:hypothetical protein
MINEFRTLLANLPPLAAGAPTPPGEEYIPAAYVPRAVPGVLKGVRGILFGPTPDRAWVNWRCREVLAGVRAAGLWDHVAALDARVLHDDPGRDLYDRAAPGTTIARVVGTGTLMAAGDPGDVGRAWFLWRVAPDGAGNLEAREYVDGTPTGVAVAGTATSVTVLGGLQLAAASPAGTVWDVDLVRPPPNVLPLLAAAETFAGTRPELLRVAPPKAVRAYRDSPYPLVRLGGLAVCLVYAQRALS